LDDGSGKTGIIASGVLHAALFAAILIGFCAAPKFEDASEGAPVETVSLAEFDRAMHGQEAPRPPAPQPKPAPIPPQPPPDLRASEEAPPPPPKTPPPRPIPLPPTPPPEPTQEAIATPVPSPRPMPVETPPGRPKEPPPEPPSDRPKPVEMAKLIAKEPAKPAAKAYDPKAIAKLIADARPSDARPPAARGLPQHSTRMSPSLAAALESWLEAAYNDCWSRPPTMPPGDPYVAQVQVEFNSDGSLASTPVLLNPPADPVWRSHAESAMRAALKCNPMKIPAQFAPYFEQWRSKTIHFDPRDALG